MLRIKIDESLYDQDAAKRAAHRLGDRFSVLMERTDGELWVSIDPKSAGLSITASEIHEVLLDESLRGQILKETIDIRNALIAKAFSSAVVSKSPGKD